jgi:hypothetical protein
METTHLASPPLWVSFVPLLTLAVPFLIMTFFLARRKGRSLVLYGLLAIIPGVNVIAALWLASQTDASVRAELADIRRRIDAKV